MFFNFYFLLVACSQFVPILKVGFLFTFLAPLLTVILISLMKEGWDDLQRYRQDKEINNA